MKRLICILFLVAGCGGGDACNPDTACSPGSPYHYKFCSGGSADDCYYQTGDGTKFHCATCGDCSGAQSLVADWCEAEPTRTSNNSVSGCGQWVACPANSGSYQFCTSGSCAYHTSDGSTFECNSCSDCGAATQRVASFCGAQTNSNTNNTDCSSQGSSCQTCCTQAHPAGANFYYQEFVSCGCSYCGSSCTDSSDVCHGGSTQSQSCAQCMSNAASGSCESPLLSACQNDADCNAFMLCASQCPAA